MSALPIANRPCNDWVLNIRKPWWLSWVQKSALQLYRRKVQIHHCMRSVLPGLPLHYYCKQQMLGERRPGYEAISYQVTLTEGVWPRDTERSNCYDTETTYYKLCSVLTLTSRDPYTENNSLQISYPDVKRSLHWQSLTTNFLPWHQEIPIVMCWSFKNAAINWPYLQTRETCWPSVTMDYKCQDDLHQQDQLLQINSHEIKYHKINFLWEQLI